MYLEFKLRFVIGTFRLDSQAGKFDNKFHRPSHFAITKLAGASACHESIGLQPTYCGVAINPQTLLAMCCEITHKKYYESHFAHYIAWFYSVYFPNCIYFVGGQRLCQ